MMWVRLIGGPCNGEVRKVDVDQTTLRAVRRTPAPVSLRRSLAVVSAETNISTYTLRVVHAPGGDIAFFALEGMSDFEAINSVLGPA